MGNTVLSFINEDFYINGKKTYSEISTSKPNVHGLLLNARFIQGIFDDKQQPQRFNRFGKVFHPEQNTDSLISALPQWYQYGLRAFTVGLQGGGPCFTFSNDTIDNHPYRSDGKEIDPAYLKRLDRLIQEADSLGMIVIVSYFYPGQLKRMKDGRSIVNAVKNVSDFLRKQNYTNVIIEVCNEMDADKTHPIIHTPEGMAVLLEIAREASGGLPVGCSLTGGKAYKEVCENSNIILIHGNGCSRQALYNLIVHVRNANPGKPIICNEDSQAIGNIKVAFDLHCSWGYYNNMTKQEPPVDWSITKGEDRYFAQRMAEGIGIKVPEIPTNEQYYFQGLEPDNIFEGKRWLRVASLYPENIDYVSFYCNGNHIGTCYDEPFTLFYQSNWKQGPWTVTAEHEAWEAVVTLRSGQHLVLKNNEGTRISI